MSMEALPEGQVPEREGDGLAAYPGMSEFQTQFNRSSFLFRHQLSGHPLFELPSIIELAARLPQTWEFVYWANGKSSLTDRWEFSSGERLSLVETLRGIATNDSMVILKHVDQDSLFAPVLQPLLARIVALAGPRMRADVVVGEALILISSPRRITAYHIDAETNYLIQSTGHKTLHVLPCGNPAIVSDLEMERFSRGDLNGARFREEFSAQEKVYALRAGSGVHIPSTSPHWVENGDRVSVALSVNYELRSIHRVTRIYKFNHHLRRLGLHPSAPGTSAWRDGLKQATQGLLSELRRSGGEAHPLHSIPAWKPPSANASPPAQAPLDWSKG